MILPVHCCCLYPPLPFTVKRYLLGTWWWSWLLLGCLKCCIVCAFVIIELYEICLVRARDKLKILQDAGTNSDTDSISSFTGFIYAAFLVVLVASSCSSSCYSCSSIPKQKLRFLAHQISWMIDWVIDWVHANKLGEWVIVYAILLHGLAQQRRLPQKWNLAQR